MRRVLDHHAPGHEEALRQGDAFVAVARLGPNLMEDTRGLVGWRDSVAQFTGYQFESAIKLEEWIKISNENSSPPLG